MKKYLMKIKLLSDLCVSDGGVYNSYLDTDICHDSYGFPYIPARRIKGCLRECGLELADWGENISKEKVIKLFGSEGADTNRAKVRIGDAVLKNYQILIDQVNGHKGNMVFHPQNVLSNYSYIRTQTSIDYGTGVADPTTLRTLRVANKGLKFVAEVEVEEEYKDLLKKCCDTFTNMGIGRTRGLGEIKVKLEDAEETDKTVAGGQVPEKEKDDSKCVELEYEITLKEPMICKSTDGGETKSLDYIEGSKILGLIAREVKKGGGDFVEFMGNQGTLICSNAYLAVNNERCVEVPASYYSIKNNDINYREKREMTFEKNEGKDEGIQLNQMKHCYIHMNDKGELIQENVELEERYHHRRPEDKSIGKAKEDEDNDSNFYQISSIMAGQSFRGYICGTTNQIEKINNCLKNLGTVYLGYSHSSEYGKSEINIVSLKKEEEARQKEYEVTDFFVKLESPTLIYNDKAFYSSEMKDLDNEIRAALGLENLKVEDQVKVYPYINYTTLGGFNVTWNARKPMVEAFDKGSILYYHLSDKTKIEVSDRIWIGERNSEGYGEVSFKNLSDPSDPSGGKTMAQKENCILKNDIDSSEIKNNTVKVTKGSLAQKICKRLFLDFIRANAVEGAAKLATYDNKKEKTKKEVLDENEKKIIEALRYNIGKIRPLVGIMLLLCQDMESLEQVDKAVKKRFDKSGDKEEKMELAKAIIYLVRANFKNSPDICEGCGVQGEENNGKDAGCKVLQDFNEAYDVDFFYPNQGTFGCEFTYIYLNEFLQQLKYIIRQKDNNSKAREEDTCE